MFLKATEREREVLNWQRKLMTARELTPKGEDWKQVSWGKRLENRGHGHAFSPQTGTANNQNQELNHS